MNCSALETLKTKVDWTAGGRIAILMICALSVVAALPGEATAETMEWINTDGGVWHNAANWDPANIPNAGGEEAIIPDDGFTYTIDINSNTNAETISFLNPNLLVTLPGVQLRAYHNDGIVNHGTVKTTSGTSYLYNQFYNELDGEVYVTNGTTLIKDGSTLTNHGTIFLNADMMAGSAIFRCQSLPSLLGTGELVMSTSGDPTEAQVTSYYSNLTNGEDHIIRGDGQISAGLYNYGMVRADQPGKPLYVVTNEKRNYGTFEAVDGATMWIECSNVYQDSVGTILADNGTVEIHTTYLHDGILDTDNGGLIECKASFQTSGVTNNGQMHLLDGVDMKLHTSMVNNDQILLNSNMGVTSSGLTCYSTPTINGSGEIVMQANGEDNDSYLSTYITSVTQGEDHTIRGSGLINGYLVNYGDVIADDPSHRLLMSGGKENYGQMHATGDGELVFASGTVTQNESGVIFADGANVLLDTGTIIIGGTLTNTGDGAIECTATSTLRNVTNDGQLNVRESAGTTVEQGITNNGQVLVNSNTGTANAYVQFNSAPTLGGNGEIVLQSGGEDDDAYLSTYYTTVTQAADHTIRGSGTVYATLINNGTVNADDATHRLLLTGAKTNNNQMTATNGAELRIVSGTITQSESGVINANGATVALGGDGAVSGGSLTSNNGGAVECVSNNMLTSVTNSGQLNVRGGGGFTMQTGMVNNGQIVIHSAGDEGNGWCQFQSSPTLSGTGEMVMQHEPGVGEASLSSYYTTGTQGAEHTIRGSGNITASLVNYGAVWADDPVEPLSLTSGGKTNNGFMGARNGGRMQIGSGAITQGETGTIVADNGTIEMLENSRISNGTIDTFNNGSVELTTSNYLVSVTNNGMINVRSNGVLQCQSGMVNNGTITVHSDTVSAIAYLQGVSDPTIWGTGEVVLDGGPDSDLARIVTYYTDIGQGEGHTIRGNGIISHGFLNYGSIHADQPHRQIGVTTSNFRNYGEVVASDSSTCRVSYAAPNYASGVLKNGSWRVEEASTLRVMGASISRLNAEVILSGVDSNFFSDDGVTRALTNLAAVDTLGHFSIQNSRGFNMIGALSNAGRVTVGEACSLVVEGAYTQAGWNPPGEGYDGRGWLTVDGVLISGTNETAVVDGGTVMGRGTIVPDLVTAGRTNPGSSVGMLTLENSFTQVAGGELFIEIGGSGEGDYDRLIVAGDAELAGKIYVQTVNDFTPADGDTFMVMTCGSRSGEFDLLYGNLGEGLQYSVEYYDTYVTLIAYADLSDVEEEIVVVEPELSIDAISFSSRPSNGSVMFELQMPSEGRVDIRLFDFNGRQVTTLASGDEAAGIHNYRWDGQNSSRQPVGSGVYFGRAVLDIAGQRSSHRTRTLWIR